MWAFATRMSGSGSLVLQEIDPAKPVGTRIYGSPLLETCYEIISSGGTGGNIIIKKWTHGAAGSTLATAAHGLTTGDNYVLEVRWVSGKISAYLNGSTTALWTYDTGSDLGAFTSMGFGSSTDLARVASAKIYTLTTTFAALADVAWWVANGTLYASDSGRGGGRAIGTFFDPDATVSGAEYHQTATIEDGTRVVEFDAVLMTAAAKVNAAGKMPDQTALNTPPGFSTSKFVLAYNDRLGYLKDQYAIFTALGTDDDLDLTVDVEGKAFVWPSEVGEPLLGAFVAAKNRLIMWGRRSKWEMTGDPVLGADVTRIDANTGGSGPNSACMVQEGTILLHTEQGAQVIHPGGNPSPLSELVLTDIINGPTVDTHYCSVVQDTKSFGIWMFFTPIDGSQGGHLFYDERTGRFNPEGGGFWPIQFAEADVQPTCAMRYQGDVVFGTLDGRMMTFNKAVAGTDGGEEYESRLMLQMAHPDDAGQGISLREIALVMGDGSDDTTLTLFGGDTPETAFAEAWTLWTGTMTYRRNTFAQSTSSPAIVLRIGGTGIDWALERCQVEYGLEPLVIQPRRPALTASAICAPPATTTTPDDNTGGGPGPDSGDPGTGGACALCADWMTTNHTDTFDASDGHGAQQAYQIGADDDWTVCLNEAFKVLDTILAANICKLPDKASIWLLMYSVTDNVYYGQTYANLATPQGTTPYKCYFRCIDSGL